MRHPKSFRKDVLGMTQEQLAFAVERTQPSVSEWEDRGIFPSNIIPLVLALGRKTHGEKWTDAFMFDESLVVPESFFVSGEALA